MFVRWRDMQDGCTGGKGERYREKVVNITESVLCVERGIQ